MNTKIDWTKPVQTRDGRKARVLCTDIVGGFNPVVAAYIDGCAELVALYSIDGKYFASSDDNPRDLINIPEKQVIEYWVNIYQSLHPGLHLTKALAECSSAPNRIACIRVKQEYTVGEGLHD